MNKQKRKIAKYALMCAAVLQFLSACASNNNLFLEQARVHPINEKVIFSFQARSEEKEQPTTTAPVLDEDLPSSDEPDFDERTYVGLKTQNGIQMLTLRSYLTGVLYAELPEDFSLQAMKAQAVAARTFALKKLLRGEVICDDPSCCQAYHAVDEQTTARMKQAVIETNAQVLYYENELIEATYFSCSGGMTEAAVEVWGNDVAYLQAVASPGEEMAPRFEETIMIPLKVFREKILAIAPEADFSRGVVIEQRKETAGEGVRTIRICGEEFTGLKLRELFSLRSTRFTMSTSEYSVSFHCSGYGHRVGMSQYGAQAMAEAGADYCEILSYYYKGTEIKKQS